MTPLPHELQNVSSGVIPLSHKTHNADSWKIPHSTILFKMECAG